MEYMIGIEGIRFLLLWYLSQREKPYVIFGSNLFEWLNNGYHTWRYLALFLFWRVFLFDSARSVTDVGAISQLYVNSPVVMFSRLIIETIKDFFETVVLAWFVPFYKFTSGLKNLDLVISVF